MRVVVGSDHGGFELKQALVPVLQSLGAQVEDLGTHRGEPCDYPDQALAVAEVVRAGRADWGLLVDGAGVGSAIAANKVPGIRAAVANEIATARNARAHNDANILVLGSRIIGRGVAEEIVRVFATTPHEGGRHQRRVDKIRAIEATYARDSDDQRHLLRLLTRRIVDVLAAAGLFDPNLALRALGVTPAPGDDSPDPAPVETEPPPRAAFWTEADVRAYAAPDERGRRPTHLPAGTRLTPLARDLARHLGLPVD